MQSTIYVEMAPGVNVSDLYDLLKSTYQVLLMDEVAFLSMPFQILSCGKMPA